jgi:hypothetical protein
VRCPCPAERERDQGVPHLVVGDDLAFLGAQDAVLLQPYFGTAVREQEERLVLGGDLLADELEELVLEARHSAGQLE